MKVGILGTRGIPPKYGGFETLADELAKGLATLGHEVVVYSRTGYGYPSRQEVSPNVKSIRTPAINSKNFESLSAGLTSALHAGLIDRPDVVLFCNPSNIWALKLLRFMRVPGVLHVAGLEHQRLKWQGLGARVLSAATNSAVKSNLTLMSDSDAIARWYRQNLKRHIEVVKYGVRVPQKNADILSHFGLTEGSYDIVVARWDADNHVAEIIRAHRLSGAKTRLVVVGHQTRVDHYTTLIQDELEANPLAYPLGAIWDQKQLGGLYAGARYYIHGHSAGGTNPALLLGGASGAEVLAHRNDFNCEVVGDEAWLWSNTEELIGLLQSDEPRVNPKAIDLTRRIIERYNWDTICLDYEDLLSRVVRKAKARNA